MTRLITIPFSHYCEKARWCLDRCGVRYVEEPHLPILHARYARRAGGGRTVPVLVADDGQVIADSTPIAAWADTRQPGALLGTADVRAAALALEDEFDLQLGPATRRWAYFQILPRKDMLDMAQGVVPRWELALVRAVRPVAVAMLRRGLTITPDGAERSRVKIETVFAHVNALLADGRRYLTGDQFTIADLTFAALSAPVLRPPEQPFSAPPSLELPPAATAQVATWRATAAGRHALRVYAEHRRAPR